MMLFHINYNSLLSFSSFSSPSRFSTVNVLFLFNPSLIIFAPSSPILLTIYFIYISFSLSLFHTHISFSLFLFFCISLLLSSYFLLFFFITTQIQFFQCTITFQCFTYHLCSFCSNVVTYLFHLYIIFIIIISHHTFLSLFLFFFISLLFLFLLFHHNPDTV